MRSRFVTVAGCFVFPDLDYRHVIGAAVLGQRLKADVAGVAAAVAGHLLDEVDAAFLFRRHDINVGHTEDTAATFCRLHFYVTNTKRGVRTFVVCAAQYGTEFFTEFLGVCGVGMCSGRRLVFPCLEYHKLVGLADALQDFKAQVAVLLVAGITEFARQCAHLVLVGKTRFKISHDVSGVAVRGARSMHVAERQQNDCDEQA